MKANIRKLCIFFVALVLTVVTVLPFRSVRAEDPVTVTILHTNDVHCGISGYPKLAAYKDSFSNPVVLVDAGDHAQGDIIGTITEGQKIIEIMNACGYDVATPGNHEFDYKMPGFLAMVASANYPYISANFTKADGTTVDGVEPYCFMHAGGHCIGFVGISTPETYTKSTPVYFQDENGNWVYTFNENDLFTKVQNAVNAVRNGGAEVVIALAHTGIESTDERWASDVIIANTTGIDVYIDGHSHEVAENKTYPDKNGKAVHYQQTGTKLANIGQIDITFNGGEIEYNLHLVKVADLTEEDSFVKQIVDEANAEVDAYYGQVIGHSDFVLTINDENGKRRVRSGETNMGDFNADAYRLLTDADIALIQGGGVRASVGPGDITRAEMTKVNPWMNALVMGEPTGQQILDALEHGARNCPGENGGFFQVSGLTYKIDLDVPSSVETDDQGMFIAVNGEYRVYDVMVGGEPLDVNKTYKVISTGYILQQSGDGMTMFNGTKIVKEYDEADSEFLCRYLEEYLHGEVPEEYRDIAGQGRIVFAAKPIEYTVTTGADSTWNGDAEGGLTLVINRSRDDDQTFDLFRRVEINGEELDPKYYTAEAGSLKLKIGAEYLNTLKNGTYKLKVVFEDGEVTTKIIINKVPATSDNTNSLIYSVSLLTSLAAAAYLLRRKED
ncbi:MAG: bifunctional metallophosphatase/5'-nucleotidase [Erysipelotrichaceae bacterium]|nr:bifunctional metallophosphatase/5'-nucleotidase [Erysipelotrichaceae bacterium]